MSIENFTGKAQAYAIGRPSYPKAAINKILKYASDDTVFADIGAGTGKFTERLLESNCSIYAIEPNDDMLLQLKKQLDRKKQVTILKGTSEATQLPDQSVDIVTVAHALHWFDLEAFKKECQRIIRPNGYVIAIYNHIPGKENHDTYRNTINQFFSNPSIETFSNPIDYTRDKWQAYIASQDDQPLPSDSNYQMHIKAVNDYFDQESNNGILHMERLTVIYSEKFYDVLNKSKT